MQKISASSFLFYKHLLVEKNLFCEKNDYFADAKRFKRSKENEKFRCR